MSELEIGDQTIRYDREGTAAIYATIQRGDAEECGCPECQNFARQRSSAYPETFLALLEQLGIDPQKEGEGKLKHALLDTFTEVRDAA